MRKKIEYAIGLFMFLSLIFGLQLLEDGSLNLSNKNTEEKDVPVSMGQRKKEIFVYSENIKNILEKRGDEEIAFLNKYPTALRWIRLSSFDFNGDGVGEIILSDEYVETSTIVSYNQVYDVGGKLLFRFVAGDILDTEVFVDEVGSKYHIQSSLHIAAGHDVTFYERIFWLQKQEWKTELMFIEWDCRHGKEREDTEEKGYLIYDCFTEDEIANIMETGYENTIDILNTKKANGTKERLEKYVQSFKGQHKEKVTDIGIILNWEEGIKWAE